MADKGKSKSGTGKNKDNGKNKGKSKNTKKKWEGCLKVDALYLIFKNLNGISEYTS